MKALTVCEPYAWMLIHGPKRIENRSWPTNYRGPLLIHSGLSKKWLKEFHAMRFKLPRKERVLEHVPPLPPDKGYRFGHILGIVDLIDCVPVKDVKGQPFAWGPWCWITANPRPFTPAVEYRGAMGLFNVDEGVLPCPPLMSSQQPTSD